MNVKLITPTLCGTVRAPASKSELHRLLILSAFSDRRTTIAASSCADDIEATVSVLTALGAKITRSGEDFDVLPISSLPSSFCADCRGSASTLRFFIPIAAALGTEATFILNDSLSARPVSDIADALLPFGVTVQKEGNTVTVQGKLIPGTYTVNASLSSQFLSGMLLALPMLSAPSLLQAAGHPVSKPYIDLTLKTLCDFGIRVTQSGDGFSVENGNFRSLGHYTAGGDYSAASFFLVGGAIGKRPVTVCGLSAETFQGDAAVLSLLSDFGAQVSVDGDAVTVEGGDLHALDLDLSDTPDLFPPLAVLAACAKGTTRFYGVDRLRTKESDRVLAVGAMLSSLGIHTACENGVFTVTGDVIRGGVVDSFFDHRIAMSAAIAANAAAAPVTVLHAECVKKSYPAFFSDYRILTKTENDSCLFLTETI